MAQSWVSNGGTPGNKMGGGTPGGLLPGCPRATHGVAGPWLPPSSPAAGLKLPGPGWCKQLPTCSAPSCALAPPPSPSAPPFIILPPPSSSSPPLHQPPPPRAAQVPVGREKRAGNGMGAAPTASPYPFFPQISPPRAELLRWKRIFWGFWGGGGEAARRGGAVPGVGSVWPRAALAPSEPLF